MQARLPVVCSNFPVLREIVDGENCGILVDPDNEEEIVNVINYLLDNPEEARRMGQNGRKAVEDKYNWTSEAEKLLEVYKQLI